MAIINKPELDSIWASEGAKTKPPLDKIKQGWISEIPPHQYENWIQNKQDEFNAYVNQKGIPEWDGVTEYYKDKSFVQDNKKIYVSVRDSGGSLAISKQPSLDVAGDYWKVVSFSSDELKQTTGQSTKDVMSQKAVTDAIDNSTTGKADKTVSINAGSGLVGGGNLSTSRTLSVNYGTTAGTSAQGNDSRFAQGVAAFGWGNHALAGYSKTDTTYYVGEGLTQTGFRFDVKFGTTLGSVMQGNDSRVVNAVQKSESLKLNWPVGVCYTQYPSTPTPTQLFGGTWKPLFDNEGVFFRTSGGSASAFGAGIQGDAIRNITANLHMSEMIGYSVGGAMYTISAPYSPRTYRSSGAGTNPNIGFDASRVVPTANENRPKNRTIVVWQRTA